MEWGSEGMGKQESFITCGKDGRCVGGHKVCVPFASECRKGNGTACHELRDASRLACKSAPTLRSETREDRSERARKSVTCYRDAKRRGYRRHPQQSAAATSACRQIVLQAIALSGCPPPIATESARKYYAGVVLWRD